MTIINTDCNRLCNQPINENLGSCKSLPKSPLVDRFPGRLSVSLASRAVPSDGWKTYSTLKKTSPDGDKCYAFCPPTPFSLPCTHMGTLSVPGPITTITYSRPTCQAASILLLRAPAEFLISSHAFYTSTNLFRQMVWIHYVFPLIWWVAVRASPRGKANQEPQKPQHSPAAYKSSQVPTTGSTGSPRKGKEVSQTSTHPERPW